MGAQSRLSRRRILEGASVAALLAALSSPSAGGVAPQLTVEEIAGGVFVARGQHALMTLDNSGHIANLSFVIGRESVAVIDTGGSANVGAALLAAIRARTDRPVRHVISTHMHPDHILGLSPFVGLAPEFVAHAKLPRGLAVRAPRYLEHAAANLGREFDGTTIVMPQRLVSGSRDIDLGGRVLRLTAHGTAHTDNDLSVRDSETGTLFLGDLLFAEHIPTIDGSIRGWIRELDRLSTEPADRVVPGHGPASLPWPGALAPQRRYLETLSNDVRILIRSGKTLQQAMDVAARDEARAWLLNEEYHRRNVAAVFAELEWE